MKETVLWTNSSPTSSFATQDIYTSQDIDAFDYIKITFRATTSSSKETYFMIDTATFLANTYTQVGDVCNGAAYYSSNGAYVRNIYPTDSNKKKLWVGTCLRFNAQGNNNAYLIPVSVKGINI